MARKKLEKSAKPLHINLSSFAGGGKTTMARYLMGHLNAFFIPKITCRPRRKLEPIFGEYKFISRSKFEKMRREGHFLSVRPINLNEKLYHTGILEVAHWPAIPKNTDVVISLFGSDAISLKQQVPGMKLLFISFKNKEILNERLRKRCLMDNGDLEAKQKKNESYWARNIESLFEHVVYNDTTVEECGEQIFRLIKHSR